MDTAVADVARWRFSTDALPERERCAALHAVHYRRNTMMAHEALPDVPVYADFTHRRLPGLGLLTGAVEAVRFERTRRHLADGVVDLGLSVNLGGGGGVVLFGRPGGHFAPRRCGAHVLRRAQRGPADDPP